MHFVVKTLLWKHSMSLLVQKIQSCKTVGYSPRASAVIPAIQMHGHEENCTAASSIILHLDWWKWVPNVACNHPLNKYID